MGVPALTIGGSNSSGVGGKGTYGSERKSHFAGSNMAGGINNGIGGGGQESGQLPTYLSIYKQKVNSHDPFLGSPA